MLTFFCDNDDDNAHNMFIAIGLFVQLSLSTVVIKSLRDFYV